MATQPSYSIVLASRTGVAEELAAIAQQAQAATGASGAAIALREGNSKEFYCRGSSGPGVPDVGAAVRVEGTFTGACIETGEELLCEDAETDTRVDKAAARALGIRSMLITPIREQVHVAGVLAVFSAMPHAFSRAHFAVLKVSVKRISATLGKERAMAAEGTEPSLRSAPTVLRMATPPIPENVKPTFVFQRCLEAIGSLRTKLAALQSNKLIMIAAAAAILVAGAVAAVLVKKGNRGSSIPVYEARYEQQSLAPSQAEDVASKPTQPGNMFTNAKLENAENKESGYVGMRGKEPPGSHPKQLVSVGNLAVEGQSLTSHTEPNIVPGLNLGHNSPSDLSLLSQPVNNLPPAMASPAELVKVRLIRVVNPVYPNIAKTSGISGAVIVQVIVKKDGTVSNPEFIKGPVVFRDAALNAVKQWVFQPAMLDGQPIEQETRVTLKFVP